MFLAHHRLEPQGYQSNCQLSYIVQKMKQQIPWKCSYVITKTDTAEKSRCFGSTWVTYQLDGRKRLRCCPQTSLQTESLATPFTFLTRQTHRIHPHDLQLHCLEAAAFESTPSMRSPGVPTWVFSPALAPGTLALSIELRSMGRLSSHVGGTTGHTKTSFPGAGRQGGG